MEVPNIPDDRNLNIEYLQNDVFSPANSRFVKGTFL